MRASFLMPMALRRALHLRWTARALRSTLNVERPGERRMTSDVDDGQYRAGVRPARAMMSAVSALSAFLFLSGCALTSALTFNGDENSRKVVGEKIGENEIVEESVSILGPHCYAAKGAESLIQGIPAASATLAIDLAKSAAQNYLKKHNDKFSKTYGARLNFENAYAPKEGACLFLLARSLKTTTDRKDETASAYLLTLKSIGDAHELTVYPLLFKYGAALTEKEKPINVAVSLRLHSRSEKLLDDTVSLGALRIGRRAPGSDQPYNLPEELLLALRQLANREAGAGAHISRLLEEFENGAPNTVWSPASSIVFKGFPFKQPEACADAPAPAPVSGETPKPPACVGPQGFTLVAAVSEKGTGALDNDANPELDAVAKFLKEITK